MTAVSTHLVRSGMSPTVTAEGELVLGERGPDIYAHVHRKGITVHWEITAGRTGEVLVFGHTWTRAGAMVEAIAAAHRPSLYGSAR